MPPDPSDNQASEEDGLLVEAVTLLVRRQRETEAWIAEQLCRADERAVSTEQRYTELEARLSGIEDQLSRLVGTFEPAHGDPAMEERLARLREELDGLKSGQDVDGRPAPAPPDADPAIAPPDVERATPVSPPDAASVQTAQAEAASAPMDPPDVAPPAASKPRMAGIGAVLGASRQERFGLLMIAAGALAVAYAVLSQLHFV